MCLARKTLGTSHKHARSHTTHTHTRTHTRAGNVCTGHGTLAVTLCEISHLFHASQQFTLLFFFLKRCGNGAGVCAWHVKHWARHTNTHAHTPHTHTPTPTRARALCVLDMARLQSLYMKFRTFFSLLNNLHCFFFSQKGVAMEQECVLGT